MSDTPRAAIALITNPKDGKILCVWNRRYKGWGLPGGKVEPGEGTIAALMRELREETGLETANCMAIYRAPTESSDSGREVHVFRVEVLELPKSTPYTCEEGSEVDWKTREELLLGSPFKSFYEKLFKGRG